MYEVRSGNLKSCYKEWQQSASQKDLQFVDKVFLLCEKHYDGGGDVVVETMEPEDVLQEFKSMKDVKSYCGIWVEQNLNARCGEDNDPQLGMYKKYKEW